MGVGGEVCLRLSEPPENGIPIVFCSAQKSQWHSKARLCSFSFLPGKCLIQTEHLLSQMPVVLINQLTGVSTVLILLSIRVLSEQRHAKECLQRGRRGLVQRTVWTIIPPSSLQPGNDRANSLLSPGPAYQTFDGFQIWMNRSIFLFFSWTAWSSLVSEEEVDCIRILVHLSRIPFLSLSVLEFESTELCVLFGS
jgi:hypothetical protein